MARIIVYLADSEFQELQRKAEREFRSLREQARCLIIRGLIAESVAQASSGAPAPTPTVPAARAAEAEAAHASG